MPRTRTLSLSALIAWVALAASGQASDFSMSQIYSLDAGHSYVGFQIKYMGFAKVRGRFSEVAGAIRYDAANPTATSATVRIEVESLDTDHDWRDRDLKSDQWFDVQKFPVMTFRSTRAVATDLGFDLVGDLTIRDVTREIRIVMDEFSGVLKDVRADSQVVFVGRTAIDRKEFGVMGDRWSQVKEGIVGVDSQVDIELTVLGKQVNAPNFRNWIGDESRPAGRVYAAATTDGVAAALETFEALRVANPDQIDGAVLATVGAMLLKEGRVDEAVAVLEHNCGTFPEDPELHAALAEAYVVRGDIAEAKESYGIVLASDPGHVTASEVMRHLD